MPCPRKSTPAQPPLLPSFSLSLRTFTLASHSSPQKLTLTAYASTPHLRALPSIALSRISRASPTHPLWVSRASSAQPPCIFRASPVCLLYIPPCISRASPTHLSCIFRAHSGASPAHQGSSASPGYACAHTHAHLCTFTRPSRPSALPSPPPLAPTTPSRSRPALAPGSAYCPALPPLSAPFRAPILPLPALSGPLCPRPVPAP